MCFTVEYGNEKAVKLEDDLVVFKSCKYLGLNEDNLGVVRSEVFYKSYIQYLMQPKVTIRKEKGGRMFRGDTPSIEINRGYHAYLHQRHRNHLMANCVFVIPKGTKCYINKRMDQIVAERIMFKKLC